MFVAIRCPSRARAPVDEALSALPDGLHVVDHRGDTHGPTPTVVLVHGSLDRGASLRATVRRLNDLHVVTYDRRGYHHSRALPLARSLDDHVADLVALVGDGPAVVVGHSYGGDVALGGGHRGPDVIGAVGAYEPPAPLVRVVAAPHRLEHRR